MDAAGLEVLAARCHWLAGEVGAAGANTSVFGPSGQATSTAVHSIHQGVAVARTALAARLDRTGVKLAKAATAFAAQESRSADNLAALTASVAV